MKRSFLVSSFLIITLSMAAWAQTPPATPAAGPGAPGSPMDPSQGSKAPAPATAAPAPAQPSTEITRGASETDGPDPLIDMPRLPDEKLSLIGGTVRKVDRLRNRMEVDIFGGKKMEVHFDNRTRFMRNGAAAQPSSLRKGDRVYVDTMLYERRIFAKNVHVQNEVVPADAQGQLRGFDREQGVFVLMDKLSGSEVAFRLSPDATFKRADGAATAADMKPGALLAVKFSPDKKDRGLAREVTVLATPGSTFTFFGRITHLDIKSGNLAIENRADGKTYDIVFEPSRVAMNDDWQVGAEATVVASFDGPQYTAQTISVVPGTQISQDQKPN